VFCCDCDSHCISHFGAGFADFYLENGEKLCDEVLRGILNLVGRHRNKAIEFEDDLEEERVNVKALPCWRCCSRDLT
jgi:hypothetical protein